MISNFKTTIMLSGILLVFACSTAPTIERKNYYSWENDYGVDSDAIVKQVIYTTDIEGMKAHTELRKTFFNKNRYPSSSIVQVSRLYEKGHFLEVEIVAVVPKI